MPRIGIVGGGVAGTHLGLYLRRRGIDVTIYAEKTPAQYLDARLTNVVIRNGPTRERERALGVNHWDSTAPDLVRLGITINGPRPIDFSGALTLPSHAVDMRIYWPRLLEDFASSGGTLVFGAVTTRDVEELTTEYDLVVVASGRGSLSNLFAHVPEHSPHREPQRVIVAGLYRGMRYPDPLSLNIIVTRGQGEILAIPLQSFEPGLTAIAFEIVPGGVFNGLIGTRFETHPAEFEAAVLGLLREYAPAIHARIDVERFGIARARDVGNIAITPAVRRGYARLSNGKCVMALGDAHIVMDPLTGQGANKASHAARVLGEAILDARSFDEEFCCRVEQQMSAYALPVSDSCNARLGPPSPHMVGFLAAAMRHQSVADFYAEGFSHPDRFWNVLSDEGRTESVKQRLIAQPIAVDRARALDPSSQPI